MNLFAMFKEGVYWHGCFGIFSTPDAAKAEAIRQADADLDSYHEWVVLPFTLDQVIAPGSEWPYQRSDRLFATRKGYKND